MGVGRRVRLVGWTGDDDDDDDDEEGSSGGFWHVAKLALRDFLLAFLWVWAAATMHVTPGRGWLAIVAKQALARLSFAWLSDAMEGGHFNLIPALSYSFSRGNLQGYLPFLGRIPAQMLGYVLGAKLLIGIFPDYMGGPKHNTSIIGGMVVEGVFTFLAAIVHLFHQEIEQSFFARTLSTSIFIGTLRSIASAFNGVWMNPCHAFGWAWARGIPITMQHLLVYWIAPFAAAMFGARCYDSVVHPDSQRGPSIRGLIKWKSD